LEKYFEVCLQNWFLNSFSPCTYKKAKYIKTSGLRAHNINKEIIMQRKQQTNKPTKTNRGKEKSEEKMWRELFPELLASLWQGRGIIYEPSHPTIPPGPQCPYRFCCPIYA